MRSILKIFAGSTSKDLGFEIAKILRTKIGKCTLRKFSDSELWFKYDENIRGLNIFLIQSTCSPADNLMELLIMIDAAKRASASNITVIIPYFGYARQDRKDQPRVSITSKLVANILTTAGADRILTMDLHAPQLQGFFDIPLDHLYGSTVFIKKIKQLGLHNLAIVSPDAGRTSLARAYAKRLNADLILIDKRRPEHNKMEITNIIGEIEGKNIIIIDDIIDTGGTFIKSVETLKERGAKKIYGACSHAVLSGNAVDKIENSSITKLFVSNTIPLKKKASKINVISVAPLFANAIRRIQNYKSISSLFDAC